MTDWGPREPAPGTDPGPGPAFGSERDPGSAAGAASAQEEAGATPPVDESSHGIGEAVSTDSAAESADRSSAEPMPEADRAPGAGDEDPLALAQRERDEYREALIRLQADFENYKKRMLKQQTEHLERAAGQLVEKLLPVLDAADLALAHGGGEDVKQMTSALFGSLEREGLERIDAAGTPFDPTRHDAVAHEPAPDGGPQEVVEVMRAGYLWKGRVLRPAMVKVRG